MPGNYALRPRDATVAEPDLLLDTDVLIEILRGGAKAGNWLKSLGSRTIGISVLTRMEILQGARDRQEQETLISQLDNYHLVLLEVGDSIQALSWFEDYHLSHGAGIIDCLLAASAWRVGKPLYTFNVKHYGVISEVDAEKPYSR
jgi:predicted nucleic acid-binding protein